MLSIPYFSDAIEIPFFSFQRFNGNQIRHTKVFFILLASIFTLFKKKPNKIAIVFDAFLNSQMQSIFVMFRCIRFLLLPREKDDDEWRLFNVKDKRAKKKTK